MFRLVKIAIIRLKKTKRFTDSINPLNAAVNLYFYFSLGQLMMVKLASRNMQLFLTFKNKVVSIRHIILFL